MSFSWSDILDGLDSGLDVVEKIAMVVPGGQAIVVGAAALDAVVESVNKDDVKKIEAKDIGPVDTGLAIFESITKTSTSGVSVTNDVVLDFLETIAKSTGNKVDDTLVCMVRCYLSNK